MAKSRPSGNHKKIERAIISKATTLLSDSASWNPAAGVLVEWLELSRSFPQLRPEATTPLWQLLLSRLPLPPKPEGLLIGGVLTTLPWSPDNVEDQAEFAQRLVDRQITLAQQLDPEGTGILRWPDAPETFPAQVAWQAAWIWAAGQLLELSGTDPGALPQLLEIYLYETDRGFWQSASGCYGNDVEEEGVVQTLRDNTLVLYAEIPDQQRAEQVLQWFMKKLPPWQPASTRSLSEYSSTIRLLYSALQRYEMEEEATELRTWWSKKKDFLSFPL